MKISVITVTYNRAATLRDTFESVLLQNYDDVEYVVVDGKSTDGTVNLIHEYEPRFGKKLRWISEPDKGIYDAMNKGISLATGEVIGFLNSDDFLASSDVLGMIAEGIEGVDSVHGDLDFVSCENTAKVVREWRGSQYEEGVFDTGWQPAHPTFYARKRLFMQYGGFNTDFHVAADFELMFRFLEVNGASSRYLPHTLVKMRAGGISNGSLSKIIQVNAEVLKAFKVNGEKAPDMYMIRRLTPKFWNMMKHFFRG